MTRKLQGPGFNLLLHSAHLVDESQRRLLQPLGIHARQAHVLHVLDQLGEASQRDLAGHFNVSAASMSEMTKRLIKNEFIEVRANPDDRRASVLSLTPKGKELLQQVFGVWEQVDEIIIEAIGSERAGRLFSDCLSLRDALGGEAPGRGEPVPHRRGTVR